MLWEKTSGRRAEHHVEGVRHAPEVGGQHLDGAGGALRVDGGDHLRPVARAAVRQVVAVDRGDHGVAQAHHRHRLGHVLGLLRVGAGRRPAGGHGAEAAAAGADVTQDHEGGRAVLAPALVDVGAAGLLAHGMEIQPLDQAADPMVGRGVASRMRSHSGRVPCRRGEDGPRRRQRGPIWTRVSLIGSEL